MWKIHWKTTWKNGGGGKKNMKEWGKNKLKNSGLGGTILKRMGKQLERFQGGGIQYGRVGGGKMKEGGKTT